MQEDIKKIGLVLFIILFIYFFVTNKWGFLILIIAGFYYFVLKILVALYHFITKKSSVSTIVENKKEAREKWPYKKKNYFFNQTEREFYYILNDILNDKYLLFSKVRMSDLLYLPKYQYNSYYHNSCPYQNKIQSKHIDFLICDKQNIKPLLVIGIYSPFSKTRNNLAQIKDS